MMRITKSNKKIYYLLEENIQVVEIRDDATLCLLLCKSIFKTVKEFSNFAYYLLFGSTLMS